MADEQIITSIVAKSDFSNLIVDVQKLTGSLSKLQQEVAGSNRALAGQISATNAMFKETLQKTGQFSSHFVSLTSDVEKFGRNLDSGRLKLRDYFRVYQDHVRTHGGLVRDLAKQQVQLQNAVLQPLGKNAQGLMQYNVHIPRGLDLTKNKTSLLKQELQIMNKVIQDGGVQLINWGKNTQWAGRQLTVGLTLPLVAFGKAAADAFKVADQELTRLTKVYGDIAGTSSAELSKIRQEVSATAKELSAAMGVNFAETISLAADIAATGKTGNELLSSVSETTRLAVLGEVDRQEAMKATLAIQSAFKQNTEELSESINFLNAVENQTSTTLNDLVEAIPKAGPVIKGLGGSVQDLALYLTAMREGGINASEGANALKSALASLINPTNVAVEKFQGFGIDLLGIVNKNAGNVTETLFALQAALDKLNPLQKQQAIEQLFGKFQFSRLNALFENLGRQGSQTLQVLDLMKASTGELAAVANRELAAVTESASGKFKRAVESLKADMAGAGERFLTIGTKLINILDKIIQFASKLPEPVKNILAFGGAFTAILGPVIMLTGVLANFFGYIIKGLGHFKALFKGAEGFKLLTPEILAAQHAGSLLGDEFYSDALAADTLRSAIKKLSEDLIGLQTNATKARTATAGLGQVITTAAGTPVGVMGGGRSVDINNPLLGPKSRAAAHLNPRNPNDPSTIFGLTLQPIPVNRRIGANPQILMNDRLDDIEGLTTIGGVSTGVVAGEHARYQALMATLGLQSRQEIQALKKTIKMGGSVSQEFIATFDDILPITQRLSQNAATQSAAIVAELRAGKINVEQARAAIIAANAQLERDLGIAVTQYGATVGRTIDLTKTPLIDQPVVDATGKPNTRGMYRKGIFRKVMDAVGRATRTKTLGGPYSIETTRPQGLNTGGSVFYNNGDQVPGPNVNADVVPAMLTPGEFVIRRNVAQQDPDGMRALNEGRAVVIPVQRNIGGIIPMLRALQTRRTSISGLRVAGERSGRQAFTPGGLNFESMSRSATRGGTLLPGLQQRGYLTEDELSSLSGMIGAHGVSRGFLRNVGSRTRQGSYPTSTFEDVFNRFQLSGSFTPTGRSRADAQRYVREGRTAQVLPGSVVHIDGALNTKISAGTATRADFAGMQGYQMTNLLDFLSAQGIPPQLARKIANDAANKLKTSLPSTNIDEFAWAKSIEKAEQSAIISNAQDLSRYSMPFAANRGGMVPGYIGGGGISRAGLLARLGAKFKYEGKTYDGPQSLRTYRINSMDINGGKKYFGHIPGLSDKARGALYNATLDFFNTSSITGHKINGKRMFTPTSMLTAFPTIAQFAMTSGKDFLSPSDMATLQSFSGKSGTLGGTVGSSRQGMAKVYGRLFTANRGGMVPGYNRGGKIPGYMGGGLVSQMLLSSLGFMGGQAIGGQFGQTGSMMGGMLGSMAPMMMMGRGSGSDISALYDKSVLSGTKFGQSMAGQAMQGGKLSSTFARLALSLTKLNLAIGVTTAILGAGWMAWKRYQENQERVANSFGMSAEQAQKAGLKYTDYTKKLKDAMQAHKDMLERNKLVYESMTKANTPLNITIEQYKKLKKEVKQTMPDIVENLNKMSRTDAVKYAVQLKTQFVSMGMSAEEATKKVYALFSVSNKSSMSGVVIGQKAFVKIKDSITAATSAIELYNDAVKRANAKGQANAVNTAFTAIDSAIQNAIKEAGTDESGANKLSYYKAMEQTLDSINAKGSKQTKLTQDTIDAIRDQNFELGNVLRKSDTIVSAWAKYQILLSGINLDVSKLNAQQAITVNNAIQLVTETIGKSLTGKGGILNDENKRLKSLTTQYNALEKAAKGASVKEQINARDRIRALQDEINLIKKKADEKKKALREEQADENVSLQIQQKQLEYQDMLATGNLSGAAQLQLEIERLTKEQQLVLTERAIDADTERRVAPLEAQKTALERAQEKQADAAALAADKLGDLSKEIQKLKTTMSEVNNAVLTITLGKLFGGEDWINSPEGKAATAALNKILKKTGNVPVTTDNTATSPDEAKKTAEAEQKKNQTATSPEEAKKAYDEKNKKPDPSQQGKEWYDAIAGAIEKGLNKNEIVMSAKTVVINADAVVQGDKPNNISKGTLKSILKEDDTYVGDSGKELESKSLSKSAIRSIVNERGFEAGDRFTYNDVVYEVTRGKSAFLDPRAKIVQKAEGGLLKGPGTGRSDSILGMYANGGMVRVSNGEYIINADTVKNLGVPFFDAINGMKNGGLMVNYNVPKYADAGPLIEAMAYRPTMASNNSAYNINVTLNGTNLSPDDVAKAISREMKMREAMSGRNRTIGG